MELNGHIERISFEDGSWWDIKTILTRGMRKAISNAAMRIVKPEVLAQVNATEGEARKALLSGGVTGDVTAVEDAYLLAGTHAYSFAERVNLETIDALPDEKPTRVLTRMYELYNRQQITEEQRADFFEKR